MLLRYRALCPLWNTEWPADWTEACLEDGVEVVVQAVLLDGAVHVGARVERHLALVECQELAGARVLAQV